MRRDEYGGYCAYRSLCGHCRKSSSHQAYFISPSEISLHSISRIPPQLSWTLRFSTNPHGCLFLSLGTCPQVRSGLGCKLVRYFLLRARCSMTGSRGRRIRHHSLDFESGRSVEGNCRASTHLSGLRQELITLTRIPSSSISSLLPCTPR